MPALPADAPGPLRITYTLTGAGQPPRVFTIILDPQTLLAQRPLPASPPAWTRLTTQQCPNCPLRPDTSPQCPAALSLTEIIAQLGNRTSHEIVGVRVETPDRMFEKQLSLQQAIGSLTGLLLATSGCPILGKLRPMVRQHLPFASVEETKYRVLSMYLLAQYVRAVRGRLPDWQLTGLKELYAAIQLVNEHLAKRLRDVTAGDAPLNALVILDTFAQIVPFAIDQRLLEELDQLMQPYLSD